MKRVSEPWDSNLMNAEVKFSDIKLVVRGGYSFLPSSQ